MRKIRISCNKIVRNEQTPRPEILTRAEAARLLRVSPDTISRMCERGHLPCIRSGRVIRVARSQIDKMLGAPAGD